MFDIREENEFRSGQRQSQGSTAATTGGPAAHKMRKIVSKPTCVEQNSGNQKAGQNKEKVNTRPAQAGKN